MTTGILIVLFVILIFQNYMLTMRMNKMEELLTKTNLKLLNFEDLAMKKKKTIILEQKPSQ